MYCLNFQHFKTNINAHIFNCRINNVLTFNIFLIQMLMTHFQLKKLNTVKSNTYSRFKFTSETNMNKQSFQRYFVQGNFCMQNSLVSEKTGKVCT